MFPSPTSDALLRCGMALLIAAASGCGGGSRGSATLAGAEAGLPALPQPAAHARGAGEEKQLPAGPGDGEIDWQDPEPAEAQALAESVVDEPFNADKTTQLRMHITTLVDRTTGIEGFTSVLQADEASLQHRLDALGAEETATEVTIRLSGSILFDFDSVTIRADAERALAQVVEVVNAYSGRPVRVEGHTDSIASESYNQKLSERRAASVVGWLAAHGVEQSRLRTVGWGEGRPVADNGTPEGRQQNRRVEVIVEKPS